MSLLHANRRLDRKRGAGYSLVELLVASAVLAIVILVMTVMLTKGRQLNYSEAHRQRARAVIDSLFEDTTAYHYKNYANLGTVAKPDSVYMATNLKAGLTVSVGAESPVTASDGRQVQYREVSVTLTWREAEGTDAITVVRRLCSL